VHLSDVTICYRVAPQTTPSDRALATLEGVYRGTDDDRAVIETGYRSFMIPLSRIEQTRARPASGSYSLEGGLIGFGLDIAAFVFLLSLVSRCCQEGD
jgi:hypothetical protein